MPCLPSRDEVEHYARERRAQFDRMTRVSCEILRFAEEEHLDFTLLSKETQDWWRDHKASDERSEERAMAELRANAKQKLNDEERKALGL